MNTSRGFTLVESLIVIALLSILAVMASGMMRALSLRMEARSVMTHLSRSIAEARHTAIARQIPVGLCGSRNTLNCDSMWQDGVLMFADPANLGEPETTNNILSFNRITTQGARVTWRGFGNGQGLRFDAFGRASASNGSFTYCPASKDASYARQIVINRGGRARFSRDRNNDGVHEDSSGNPLKC